MPCVGAVGLGSTCRAIPCNRERAKGDAMSQLPIVCGYRRSGNHYIMSIMAEKFPRRDLTLLIDGPVAWSGERRDGLNVVKWGKLWGWHWAFDRKGLHRSVDVGRIRYVVRHPWCVMRSLQRLEMLSWIPSAPLWDCWCDEDRIRHWCTHVLSYRECTMIRYEDAMEQNQPREPAGYAPGQQTMPDEVPDDAVMDRIRRIVAQVPEVQALTGYDLIR